MGDEAKSMVLLSLAYNRFVRTARAIHGDGQVLILPYERLTNFPEETLQRICSFINIPYDETMFATFSETARQVVGEHETWKHSVITSTSVERNDPGKWRQTLSEGEGELMKFLTRRSAADLGYPVDYRLWRALGGLARDLTKVWRLDEIRRFAAEFRGD